MVAIAHGRELRIWRRLRSLHVVSNNCAWVHWPDLRYEVLDGGVDGCSLERFEKGGEPRRCGECALGHGYGEVSCAGTVLEAVVENSRVSSGG